MNLTTIFKNLKKGNFKISKNTFEKEFENSIVNVVKFFSNHYFGLGENEIEVFDLEKQISPGQIYSIINGAKPLIIECEEELPDGELHPYAYEVWLNK